MKISLNILPPQEKERLRHRLRAMSIVRYGLYGVVACGAMIVVVTAFYIAGRIEQAAQQAADPLLASQRETVKQHSDIVRANNAYASRIAAIRKESWSVARRLAHLASITPPTVSYTRVTVTASTISLKGIAQRRDDVLTLRDALYSSPCLHDIVLPLQSTAQRELAHFTITATWRECKETDI